MYENGGILRETEGSYCGGVREILCLLEKLSKALQQFGSQYRNSYMSLAEREINLKLGT